jgi:hypothetical protein
MRLTFRISLLAIGLASLLGPGAASAGTLVEFPKPRRAVAETTEGNSSRSGTIR